MTFQRILGASLAAISLSAAAAAPAPQARAMISADEAIATAVNGLVPHAGGYLLQHPLHRVHFAAGGIEFVPRRGGPRWHWQLCGLGPHDAVAPEVDATSSVPPRSAGSRLVSYERGAVIEQYLLRGDCLEQQFVIERALELDGTDLHVVGQVTCAGAFEPVDGGWMWRNEEGVVSLSQVRVFDAAGRTLAARMEATATETRIVVAGAALATATYPVTIDPEIGTNDFRISDMGIDGDRLYDSEQVAVAYNSIHGEYLVVWSGDDDTGLLADGELEIYGQRVDAASGAELGTSDFRISAMGVDGNVDFDARAPAVAYSPVADGYLVVWEGEDAVSGEFEIHGQRLDSAGVAIGADDFRISDMGPEGDVNYDASVPAVVYNAAAGEYLVVWEGTDGPAGLAVDESEIYGQRLSGSGAEVGVNDFRVSDMGPDGNGAFDARNPAVACHAAANEYLVVWEADDDQGGVVDEEFEIFAQRLDGVGSALGANDFRVSDMGPDGDIDLDAGDPAVASNGASGEYLVVWSGDDGGALAPGEFEIHGQLLGAAGVPVGINDFRISDLGPDGNASYDARMPAVAWLAQTNEYLVVWDGDDNTGGVVEGEAEIFGQRLSAAGAAEGANDFRLSDMGLDGDVSPDGAAPTVAAAASGFLVAWEGDDGTLPLRDNENEAWGQLVDSGGGETGSNDVRLSDMGPDGDITWDAVAGAVVYNAARNEYLVVWEGDDDSGALADGEIEIFGQRLDATSGAEVGSNDFRISDMGPDGNVDFDGRVPAVAWNNLGDEYLVVWEGEDTVTGEFEIYGQRLSGTGLGVGSNDFRISDMGPDGHIDYDARNPAVAWNGVRGEYLVVWEGDDDTEPLVDNESEIFAQRLSAAGVALGLNDFRISDMGPDEDSDFDAEAPAVAYDSAGDQYLVVWRGDDDVATVNGEFEIFGQFLAGISGAEVGVNDLRVSDMGPGGNGSFDARGPALVYNPVGHEFLVVWEADDNAGGVVDNETEIYGQRLDALTRGEIGVNDFRISDAGPNGNASYDAVLPAVSHDGVDDEYLVVWEADNDAVPLVDAENEIFGQFLDAGGQEVGTNDFRISDMGLDGDTSLDAGIPAVVYNAAGDEHLIVWEGDDDSSGLASDEMELYGQRVGEKAPPCPADVTGDGIIDVQDLVAVILSWGACPLCAADVTGDGIVDVQDLVAVILAWGVC